MLKKSWLWALPLVLALAFVFPANATVINFDDLVVTPPPQTSQDAWGYIPTSYQGLNWGDANNPWDFGDQAYYQGYGNTYTVPSPNNYAGPDSGIGSITSNTPFRFVGAYFSSFTLGNDYYNNDGVFPDSAHSLLITGYLNGQLVGSVEVDLGTSFGWTRVNLGGKVDRLDFQPEGGLAWMMDNFTYRGHLVPMPSTLLLLGGGLVGLVLLGRRKFTKA